MTFRIPPTSKYVQMATAGKATGVWDRRENTFYFQIPPGITKAYMEFSGIPGHYQFDFDTSQCRGSYVNWGDYDYDYESDRFELEREFSRWHHSRPSITNHPFRRLNSRLENYNPARPWTVPETRHHHSPPRRTHSNSWHAVRPTPHCSRSVSFARNTPTNPNNVRVSSSPIRPLNVNIMTPGCFMTPFLHHVRTPNPPRPASPPPYSPPSPLYTWIPHLAQLEQIHRHAKQHHPFLVKILQVGLEVWTLVAKPQKLQYLKDILYSFPVKHPKPSGSYKAMAANRKWAA